MSMKNLSILLLVAVVCLGVSNGARVQRRIPLAQSTSRPTFERDHSARATFRLRNGRDITTAPVKMSYPPTTPPRPEPVPESDGGKVVFSQNQLKSIYASSKLTQAETMSRASLVAGLGQNGAPPTGLEAYALPENKVQWNSTAHIGFEFAYGGVGGDTAAAVYTNPGHVCIVTAHDVASGKEKWSTQVMECYPGSGRPVEVSADGAWIFFIYTTTSVTNSSQISAEFKAWNIDGTQNYTTSLKGDGVRNAGLGTKFAGAQITQGKETFLHLLTFPELKLVYKAEPVIGSANCFCMNEAGDVVGWGFEQFDLFSVSETGVISTVYKSNLPEYFPGTCVIRGNYTGVGYYDITYKQNQVQYLNKDKLIYTWKYPGDPASIYQDLPVASAMTADGRHLIVGSWGNSNGTAPTVTVFRPEQSTPVYNLTTPGSVFDVSLIVEAQTGTIYAAAAGKHVHANKEGYGGDLYAIEIDP